MKYKNIVFDLYGTLVDIHTDEEKDALWEMMARIYEKSKAPYPAHVLRKEVQSLIAEKQKSVDEIQIEEIFAELFARKGVDAGKEMISGVCRKFRESSTEYIRLYPGVHELMAGLKKQGRRVYLLSNAQRAFTAHELEMLEIEPYFDGIFLSSDCGVKKPNPRFFDVLVSACGLAPEECLMIGNDENCDIAGGKSAGMGTIYLHTNLSPEYTGTSVPDCAVLEPMESLEEVLGVIGRMERNLAFGRG